MIGWIQQTISNRWIKQSCSAEWMVQTSSDGWMVQLQLDTNPEDDIKVIKEGEKGQDQNCMAVFHPCTKKHHPIHPPIRPQIVIWNWPLIQIRWTNTCTLPQIITKYDTVMVWIVAAWFAFLWRFFFFWHLCLPSASIRLNRAEASKLGWPCRSNSRFPWN